MDSKFEKWNELPPEMRLECVKWLDFKSRMQLRGVSKTDKSLVESAPKYHFDTVKVEVDIDYEPNVTCKEGSVETIKIEEKNGRRTPEFVEKAYHLTIQFLKFAVIDHFEFWAKFKSDNDKDAKDLVSRINEVAPMKFKSLQVHTETHDIINAILKKCDETETLVLEGSGFGKEPGTRYIDFCRYKPFYTAKTFKFMRLSNPLVQLLIMQKWIEIDMAIGTTIHARYYCPNFISFFVDSFKDRVVHKNNNQVRFRTDNPAKHILIRVIPNVPIHQQWEHNVAYTVIPANLKRPEYAKNDQWAHDFYTYEMNRGVEQAKLRIMSMSDDELRALMLGSDDED